MDFVETLTAYELSIGRTVEVAAMFALAISLIIGYIWLLKFIARSSHKKVEIRYVYLNRKIE